MAVYDSNLTTIETELLHVLPPVFSSSCPFLSSASLNTAVQRLVIIWLALGTKIGLAVINWCSPRFLFVYRHCFNCIGYVARTVGNDVEESSRSLFQGLMPAFAWRNCGKSRQISFRI